MIEIDPWWQGFWWGFFVAWAGTLFNRWVDGTLKRK